MIKSLSPYYLTVPFVSANTGLTCTSYVVSIFVWDGLKADVPSTATYTLTKTNPTGSTASDTTVNISKLIKDYIQFTPQDAATTSVINGNNNWWVQTSYTYVTTDAADATTPQGSVKSLYGLGYTSGIGGGNVTNITNRLLLTGREFKVDRNGFFVVPVLIKEGDTVSGSVVSSPNSQINVAISEAATTTSGELVKYIWIKCAEATTDTSITVEFEGTSVELLVQDEAKYTPVDVFFQNKEGAEQSFVFRKERKDTLSITKDTYEGDRQQPSSGSHQFIDFNVQGRSGFSLNTGFIDESNNDTIRELLMSERQWIYDGTNFIPINSKKLSLEYKTQLNEKLINYLVNFDYSYSEINNI
jgi:hypothetical protein